MKLNCLWIVHVMLIVALIQNVTQTLLLKEVCKALRRYIASCTEGSRFSNKFDIQMTEIFLGCWKGLLK